MRMPGILWNPDRREFYARFAVRGARTYFGLGADHARAEARLGEILAAQRGAVIVPQVAEAAGVVTLQEALDVYMVHQHQNPRCSPQHAYTVQWHLDRLAGFEDGTGWRMGDRPIADLGPELLQGYLETMRARGWTGGTLTHAAVHAKAALRYCVRRRLIPWSPWDIVVTPTQVATRSTAYPEEIIIEVLCLARGRDRLLLALLYETAARPSELARMRWVDVRGNRVVLEEHKTRRASGRARVIELSERAQMILDALRERAGRPQKSAVVFPGAKGQSLSRTAYSRLLRPLTDQVEGAEGLTAYAFRHSRATHLAAAGVDPAILARILGNSVTMVLSRYVHPAPDHVRAALEA